MTKEELLKAVKKERVVYDAPLLLFDEEEIEILDNNVDYFKENNITVHVTNIPKAYKGGRMLLWN